jgi:hypothetical protein
MKSLLAVDIQYLEKVQDEKPDEFPVAVKIPKELITGREEIIIDCLSMKRNQEIEKFLGDIVKYLHDRTGHNIKDFGLEVY